MTQTGIARVRSVDTAARTALVEPDGSEGAAISARLADSAHPHTITPGAECVITLTPAGEHMVLASLGHNPAEAAVNAPSAASTAVPPGSFAYTNGTTWQDALTVSVRTLAACDLWVFSTLSLAGSIGSAASLWELRVSVDGAGASAATGWGSALANLQQVCSLPARAPLPDAGVWTVRLQLRVRISGATVACTGGLLLAEARTT